MITTPQEYFNSLDILQSIKRPSYALLPTAENVYKIDANTRTVEAPPFVSVEKDHRAEVIYFSIDRFVDYMDLSTTSCMITYTNAKKKTRYYGVPFYDIYTLAYEGKILFPWCLDGNIAEVTGNVEFAISFFSVGSELDENNLPKPVLEYSFNTLPAHSKVLKGIKEQQITPDDLYYLKPSQYQELLSRIDNLENYRTTYWTIIEESLIEPEVDEELQNDLNEVIDNLKPTEDETVG